MDDLDLVDRGDFLSTEARDAHRLESMLPPGVHLAYDGLEIPIGYGDLP